MNTPRTIIKNSALLKSHGNKRARRICLDIIEHSLKAVDVYLTTKASVQVQNGFLVTGDKKRDLSKIRKVFVLGAGKASFGIAAALEEILEDRIDDGIISVKKGEKRRLKRIKVIEAGHPLPDENSLAAGNAISELAEKAGKGDLVFCAITGGASSLAVLPADGVSFDDKLKINDMLVRSGAPINEINSVRNHLSKIKGGLLAKKILPAQIVNLIGIDEIEGRPWGPTVPDTSTFADAVEVLKKHDLWEKSPQSVRAYLEIGLKDRAKETPKEKYFQKGSIQNIIVADNEKMLTAARGRARQLGLNTLLLTSEIEGESSEAGKVFASIAVEAEKRARPLRPPCAILGGGETTVKITGEARGHGGPSQEFVLGASLKLSGSKKIAVASLDTDGTDGTTDIAGGIVDGSTAGRCKTMNENIYSSLQNHSSYELLQKLGDGILVNPTNTNVMDLDIAIVL